MRVFGFLTVFLTFPILNLLAQKIYVDISSPSYNPVKLAILGDSSDGISNIINKLKYNLSTIGYFEIVSSDQDLALSISKSKDEIVISLKSREGDVFNSKALKNESVDGLAFSIANKILESVVNINEGPFGTPFVFTSDMSGKKEIYMSFFVSEKIKRMTHHNQSAISPTISPDGTKIAYISFYGSKPELFLIDLTDKKIKKPLSKPGIFMSPFFINNNEMLLSWNNGDNAKIYIFDVERISLKKITAGESDVSATISPDGNILAVSSKRDGTPQIYLYDMQKSRLKRLTFSGSYNASPSFSPKGDEIVYTKLVGDKFDIYITSLKDEEEKPLIKGFGSSESPTWTPDGNFIVFSSNIDGDYDLYVTDRKGSFIRKIFDTVYNETQVSFPLRR